MPTSISEPAAAADPSAIKENVLAFARAQGFSDVRVTDARLAVEVRSRLESFIADGRHGDMAWLGREPARRSSPEVLWPEARSAIVLGYSYAPDRDPLANLGAGDRAVISAYAKGRDYHDVVKGKLRQVARRLHEVARAEVKVFVDTAPVMEKPLAQKAGLGWQGKHTNLVSRTHGSWLFLGVVLTSAALPSDASEIDHCGSCRRCLDACPTAAFPAPYQLDARRCIAYLTIEHQGHIAPEFLGPIGNRVFGCDDCLAVCPWNKFAEASREIKFAATPATDDPPLADLLSLDDATFRQRYSGTPIKRTGRDRVVRNALIAAGNSGDPSLAPHAIRLLRDDAAIVRAMAVRACRMLLPIEAFVDLRSGAVAREGDPRVVVEWNGETSA